MLTPQDIREKAFEKAVFGGYDMGAVDNFLEEISGDYAALYKEAAVLKSKLKVLVEKVEEYRTTEDAMRMALLSAQKMSAGIEAEARQKSEDLLAGAQSEADSVLNSARNAARDEEARLVEAKRSTSQFLEKMRLLCTRQLDFYDKLDQLKESLDEDVRRAESYEEPEQELETTVRSIEDSVARMVDEEPAGDFNIGEDIDSGAIQADAEETPPGEQTRLYSFSRELPNVGEGEGAFTQNGNT